MPAISVIQELLFLSHNREVGMMDTLPRLLDAVQMVSRLSFQTAVIKLLPRERGEEAAVTSLPAASSRSLTK